MSVGKRIHHIGIVVDNLGDAVNFLTDTVGLDVTQTLDIPERGLKGGRPGRYGRVARGEGRRVHDAAAPHGR